MPLYPPFIFKSPLNRIRRRLRGVNILEVPVRGDYSGDLTDNLLAFWRLDEASGTREDAHTTNRDLTEVPTIGAGLGRVSNAASFSGAGAGRCLNRIRTALEGTDRDFSICSWVKFDSGFSGLQFVVDLEDSVPVTEYRLIATGTPYAFLWYYGQGVVQSPASVVAGVWYFLYAWHRASDNQIGIKVNNSYSTTSTGGTYTASAGEFTLGNWSPATGNDVPLDGVIDMTGVWSKLLTDADLAYLYNSGFGRNAV